MSQKNKFKTDDYYFISVKTNKMGFLIFAKSYI